MIYIFWLWSTHFHPRMLHQITSSQSLRLRAHSSWVLAPIAHSPLSMLLLNPTRIEFFQIPSLHALSSYQVPHAYLSKYLWISQTSIMLLSYDKWLHCLSTMHQLIWFPRKYGKQVINLFVQTSWKNHPFESVSMQLPLVVLRSHPSSCSEIDLHNAQTCDMKITSLFSCPFSYHLER